MPVMKVMFGNL